VNDEVLRSWHAGPTRRAIVDFVSRTCGEDGSDPVPPEERVAVFDNDGTLWCEKPMPIQLDFILRRLAVMAAERPELSAQQPWKAVTERDYGWFGALMDEHYAGDDTMSGCPDLDGVGLRHPTPAWPAEARRIRRSRPTATAMEFCISAIGESGAILGLGVLLADGMDPPDCHVEFAGHDLWRAVYYQDQMLPG
jgi:hypothetical protein